VPAIVVVGLCVGAAVDLGWIDEDAVFPFFPFFFFFFFSIPFSLSLFPALSCDLQSDFPVAWRYRIRVAGYKILSGPLNACGGGND
jgi:hypothetical protein